MTTETYKFTTKLVESYDTTTLHPQNKELKTTHTFKNNTVTKMTLQDFNLLTTAS